MSLLLEFHAFLLIDLPTQASSPETCYHAQPD